MAAEWEAGVLRLARVMSLSARRWASLALGQVVLMLSCWISDVTRLRRRAIRWEDLRPRCRCLRAPPAMVGGGGGGEGYSRGMGRVCEVWVGWWVGVV